MDILQVDFDGLRQDSWTEQEADNARLVADFIQQLMNNHDFDAVRSQFGNSAYVQHSRGIRDGMEGVIETVSQLAKRFPDYTYDVKRMLVDGDYVIFHSHATVRKQHRGNDRKGFNIKDSWRIKDGQIAEHWDAIEPLDGFMRFYGWLTGGRVRNSNGVF